MINTYSVYIFYYKLGDQEYVKIGYSSDVEKRVADLQTPEKVIWRLAMHNIETKKTALALENFLHGWFDSDRVNGEWFKINKGQINRVITLINRLCKIFEIDKGFIVE